MQFLGFANFYRRFIKNFSKIASPMTEMLKGSGAMLKKNRRKVENQVGTSDRPFLTPQAAEAFRVLKEAFLTAPVLQHFDSEKQLRVETDASDKAIGAILCQPDSECHWHPIAYLSRKMIPAECNYEVHDKELLAIVESFKHWRHYLEGAGHEVLVLTDHNNLRKFMETTRLSPRQVRWAQELSRYNFRIDYRPGTKNPADGLSRRPDLMGSTDEEVECNRQILRQLQESLQNGQSPSEVRRLAALQIESMVCPVSDGEVDCSRPSLRQMQEPVRTGQSLNKLRRLAALQIEIMDCPMSEAKCTALPPSRRLSGADVLPVGLENAGSQLSVLKEAVGTLSAPARGSDLTVTSKDADCLAPGRPDWIVVPEVALDGAQLEVEPRSSILWLIIVAGSNYGRRLALYEASVGTLQTAGQGGRLG